MRRVVWVGLLLVGLAATGLAGFAAVNSQGPSAQELDADIAGLDREIADAQATSAKYGEGSVLRFQSELTVTFLATTRAMLDQKRRSWFRGISLSYVVEGKAVPVPSREELAQLEQDLASSRADAEAARIKGQGYTGGMLQVMALLEEQTHRVTAAAAQMRLSMARLGFAVPATAGAASKPPSPIGRTLDDKGAL